MCQKIPEHVTQIAKMLTDGNALSDVVEYAESRMSLSRKEVSEIAFEWFVTASNTPHEYTEGWCMEAYRELYRKLVDTGDYNGAIKCVSSLHAISKSKEKSNSPAVKLRLKK